MVRFISVCFMVFYKYQYFKELKKYLHIVTNIISNTGYPKQNKSMQMSMN